MCLLRKGVFFFYQRCRGLLNIQNELSYVASVMNSLHCLFHLRTTHTNYFPAIKLSQKWLGAHFFGYSIWKMIWCTLQSFLSVVILVIKTKTASSTRCLMLLCRRYQKDFIQQTSPGLSRILHDIAYSKHSFSKTSTNLMKGAPLENNIMTASSVSSSLIYTDSCWPITAKERKIKHYKTLPSCLITVHMDIQLNVPLCLEAIVSQEVLC